MSQLLGMSFDVATSPSISLHREQAPGPLEAGAGWGFAWYPADNLAATVIRDPRPVRETGLTQVLQDWDRFRGTVFLCHIRGAAKRPTEQDTHPFSRAYARREFTFAHNGQLDPAKARALDLGDPPMFEPMGSTDSEQAFCWLLTRMRLAGARSFAEAGYERLHGWLRELDELGTLNVIMSDGQDLIAYADGSGFRPLHFARRVPPHAETRLENAVLTLDHSDPLDQNRTMALVSTTPLGQGGQRIAPGHMLAVRRAAIVYRSEPDAGSPREEPAQPADVPRAPGGWTSVEAFGATQTQPVTEASPPRGEQDPPVSRRYRVLHETLYEYEEPVEHSTHTLRLQPVHSVEQRVVEHDVDVSVKCEARSYEDVFGNRAVRLWIEEPYKELRVVATSIVEVLAVRTPVPHDRTTLPLVWMPWQRQMMTPFLLPSELPETQLRELSDFAMSFADRQDYDVVETLRDVNRTIRNDFAYLQGKTSVETTPFDVYVHRRGVCQDFANLFICLCRLLGVPARYRVGYIHTGADYENQLQSEASHAWVEVYLPWAGWRGFDPTNGCPAGLDHIAVASGRNYRDATPMLGTLYKGGRNERLSVRVEVEQLDPAPQPEGTAAPKDATGV